MRLTTFYSSASVCTPARSSLMTGCYAQRVDMSLSENGVTALQPVSLKGLNPKEITIAEILKEKGYATACLGKWHLGDQPEFLPINHGFDVFLGIPYSEDMTKRRNWPDLPLVQNDRVIEAPVDLTKTTRRYVEKAISFMTENKDKPSFLYFPTHQPGSNLIPLVDDRFRGKSANGAHGDSVEELDWSVGQIINALNKLGIREKTMIVFTSDNGAILKKRENYSSIGSNEPFSGGTYTTMEGGMRVPCIVEWPGKIKSGTTCDELCTIMDWSPTFANLAGAKIPDDRVIDGKNIWSLISGVKNAKTPYDAFYYYNMNQLQAVREGKWKLHLPLKSKYNWWRNNLDYESSELKLIDLSKDFNEEYDLSEQHPEVVERLLRDAEKIREDLGDSNLGGEGIRPALYIKKPLPLLMQ